jgi:hypothetical protein
MNKSLKKWLAMLLGITEPILAVGQLPIPTTNVTNGSITVKDNTIYVDSDTSRISFPESTGEGIYIKARYEGPSSGTVPFASGAVVEQVGVKLREVNTCNLLYIMRRLKPASNITIQTKENPGLSTHNECGANGYTTIAQIPIPENYPGDEITLSAKLYGDTLVVWCNGQKVFSGVINFKYSGNTGIRTDNIKTSIRLFE